MLDLFLIGAAIATAPAPTCFHNLTKASRERITQSDKLHDVVGDSSISCNFGLTPSEAQEDLNAIVAAAQNGDCQQLIQVSNIPLSVADRTNHTTRMPASELCRHQSRVRRFILRNAKLFTVSELNLIGWRGAFVGTEGILINTVKSNSGRPHLKLIAIGPI